MRKWFLLPAVIALPTIPFLAARRHESSPSPKHRICYVVRNKEINNVFVSDLDGKNRIQITNAVKSEDQTSPPIISPDGNRVAFAYHLTIGYLYDISTGKRTQITHFWPHSYIVEDLAFSPDSKRLAVSYLDGFDTPHDIAIFDVNGGGKVELAHRKIADEDDPVFSHDGSQVAYTSNLKGSIDGQPESLSKISDDMNSVGRSCNIYLSDFEGHSTRQLTHEDGASVFDFQFSPDDKSIWFKSTKSKTKIFRVDLTSGVIRQVFDGARLKAKFTSFAPSLDGKSLFIALGRPTQKYLSLQNSPTLGFDSGPYLNSAIKRMDLKTCEIQNVVARLPGDIRELRFSTGSPQLFFTLDRLVRGVSHSNICSVKPDGTGFRNLTKATDDSFFLTVS